VCPNGVHPCVLGGVVFEVKNLAAILHKFLVVVQGILKALRMGWSFWGGGLLVISIEKGKSHIASVSVLLEGKTLGITKLLLGLFEAVHQLAHNALWIEARRESIDYHLVLGVLLLGWFPSDL
jgi:hypothetical protein